MVWAYEGKYEGFLGNFIKIFVESFGVWIDIAMGRGFYGNGRREREREKGGRKSGEFTVESSERRAERRAALPK